MSPRPSMKFWWPGNWELWRCCGERRVTVKPYCCIPFLHCTDKVLQSSLEQSYARYNIQWWTDAPALLGHWPRWNVIYSLHWRNPLKLFDHRCSINIGLLIGTGMKWHSACLRGGVVNVLAAQPLTCHHCGFECSRRCYSSAKTVQVARGRSVVLPRFTWRLHPQVIAGHVYAVCIPRYAWDLPPPPIATEWL